MSSLAEVLSAPAPVVAPRLLGAVFTHGDVALRITEVEAYGGADDPGSHAFRRTPRSSIMFGPPGRLYCYLIYGMHVCANVVCAPDGEAGAVLIRAAQVIAPDSGDARGSATPNASGPGRLARVAGLDLTHNGLDLATGPVHLQVPLATDAIPAHRVRSGPRVGLRNAPDRPWRYWIDGDPTVSPYRAVRSR